MPQLPIEAIDNIMSYLPPSVQAKISQRYYDRVAPMAASTIATASRIARERMGAAVRLEQAIGIQMARAHYILHYPEDSRYEYARLAIMAFPHLAEKVDLLDDDTVREIRGSASVNQTIIPTKRLFRAIIQEMSIEELSSCGW